MMLFLQFRIGDDSLALATDRIVEIVPLVSLTAMRQAPEGVAGCFEYRGKFVPVVDLCVLELGRPARQWLSTRIVLLRHPADEAALIGLVVERATEVLKLEPADFAPFAAGPHGLLQRVELEQLLPATLLAYLSSAAVQA